MNKPSIHEKGQSGQAIVLIALTMIILLGAIGLAIDGGGMFLLYRDAQNAVDSASLSAAFALCTEDDPIAQAYRTLDLNGFDPTDAGVTITVNRPPQNTGNPDYENDENHIQIILNAEKPSYFIQAVYQGPLVINVEAISFCDPGSATTSASPERQHAFNVLRDPDECTSSSAWEIRGTDFTIEGDVWLPNIDSNDNFNPHRVANPEETDDVIDVLGNIYIGVEEASNPFTNLSYELNEDLSTSAANSITGFTGYGGDGTIDFGAADAPQPDPLPHTMDYYRPAGSPLCIDATECGGLQAEYPSNYFDISAVCATGNKVEYQDFGQNFDPSAFDFSTHYDVPNSSWIQDGIYYSTCPIILNHENMDGNVSFISEDILDFNSTRYTLTAYEDAPLIVTNFNSTGSQAHGAYENVQDCGGGNYALKLNATFSYLQGVIIAFRGKVHLDGTDWNFDTCINATGIVQNGNSRAVYRCVPGQAGSAPGSYGQRE